MHQMDGEGGGSAKQRAEVYRKERDGAFWEFKWSHMAGAELRGATAREAGREWGQILEDFE